VGLERVAARAASFDFEVLRMNPGFHCQLLGEVAKKPV
jgi:hypothetical protein